MTNKLGSSNPNRNSQAKVSAEKIRDIQAYWRLRTENAEIMIWYFEWFIDNKIDIPDRCFTYQNRFTRKYCKSALLIPKEAIE